MFNPIAAYTHWLHTQWPAGKVEKLPDANPDGSTNVPGLYIVGDLTGIPLLKLSADSGAKAVQTIVNDRSFKRAETADTADDAPLDLAIVGGGTAGFAAALEARKHNLRFKIIEASEPFSTIVNFPKAKPIYTYPTELTPAGDLQFHDKSDVKEGLLEDLREQTIEQGIEPMIARVDRVERKAGLLELHLEDQPNVQAQRVIVAIGRSGAYRKLDVPGEELNKVYNRLHDPADYAGQNVLVVGGGDSALETAIALTEAGSHVTLSYRGKTFSRPKPDNIDRLEAVQRDGSTTGSLTVMLASNVEAIRDNEVDIADADGQTQTLTNDVVFAMIGREPPLDFFRKSGAHVRGDWRAWSAIMLGLFMLFCLWLYHWKGHKAFLGIDALALPHWLIIEPSVWLQSWRDSFGDTHILYTLLDSMGSRSFYYTFVYSACVVIFGIARIRRRKTPYVTWQTVTLMVIQVLPLFILPEILLPWFNRMGWFDAGVGAWLASTFFPGDSWWRAYGLILAWPLMAWNWFTAEPIIGWLILGSLQTFVIIPAMIFFWGKGAYCGWICSCGALAETLGDTHRHKMPHGPIWNRLNMVGQVFLLFAFVLMGIRIVGWVTAPAHADTQAWLGQGSYDAAADVTKANLYNLEPAQLQALQNVTIPEAGTFAIASIGDSYADDYGGVPVTLVGDASAHLDQNVTLSWSSELHAWSAGTFDYLATQAPVISWSWMVDLFWAGVLGVGLYFWYSGRVWCRFACPLAALMHIYHRFGRFRILADKSKCISCNVCTTVCHQGIDVMSFANKGETMADPQCVRCSACVQSCPTGVLSFGQVDRGGNVIREDPKWLAASPVRMTELTVNGKHV